MGRLPNESSMRSREFSRMGDSLADHNVVVISESNWFEPPRIRHQVARQMARFTRVVFVEIPSDWRQSSPSGIELVAPNIYRCRLGNPHRLPRRLHLYAGPLRERLNRRHLSDLIATAGELLGDAPVLINFNYDFAEAMRSRLFGVAIYYCNDEFTTWAPGQLARKIIVRRERATAAAADGCLTVSVPLTEKILRWNANTRTLLPGHELEERLPGPRRPGPIRVAFMGYLNSRIHYDWLAHAAQQDDIEVHMIGPVVEANAAARSLLASPSVVAHGPRVGRELQDILLDADVLVLPYVVSAASGMLAATAPNKLYTYLAVAKPIVASALPALLSLDEGLLYRASSATDFVSQVRRAFAEDNDAFRQNRLKLGRDNRWDRRGDELRDFIETLLERRASA